MAIEVDWTGVGRTRRAMGGEAAILSLKADVPLTAPQLDEALPPDDGEGLANGGWFEGPKGWMLFIEGLPAEVRAWVSELAACLDRAGIPGLLTGAGPTIAPAWARRRLVWQFASAFGYHPDGLFPHRGWACGPDLLHRILGRSAQWVTRRHSDLRVNLDGRAEFRVDPVTARTLMRGQVQSGAAGFYVAYDPRRHEQRTSIVRGPGSVDFGLSADSLDWREAVSELRTELLNAPRERLSVAVLSSSTTPFLGAGRVGQEPYVDYNAVSFHPELWREFMVDPCGIQILTDQHLTKATDLTNWTITRLDDNHHLVEAKNLDAWYDHPFDPRESPDRDLLDRARGDFGDMILSRPLAQELGLNKKPNVKPT